jgi:hypothetical protein
MKIKLLSRTEWEEQSEPLLSSAEAPPSLPCVTFSVKSVPSDSSAMPQVRSFGPGKTEELVQFTGLQFQDDAQMLSFLNTLIAKGNSLKESYGPERPQPLSDGQSAALPDLRLFEEIDPDGDARAYWAVELDRTDGPKKEQVSLTLNATVLRRLREEAKRDSVSLSALIDSKLMLSLSSPTDKLARQVEGMLTQLQKLCDRGWSDYKSIENKE